MLESRECHGTACAFTYAMTGDEIAEDGLTDLSETHLCRNEPGATFKISGRVFVDPVYAHDCTYVE